MYLKGRKAEALRTVADLHASGGTVSVRICTMWSTESSMVEVLAVINDDNMT